MWEKQQSITLLVLIIMTRLSLDPHLFWCKPELVQSQVLDGLLSSRWWCSQRYPSPIVGDLGAAAPITRRGGGARGGERAGARG